jgi:hypothetical protein
MSSFEWMEHTARRPGGHERRLEASRAEIAHRAGLFYRLGFSQKDAIERLKARVIWEHGSDRHPSLSDDAVATIVSHAYNRRPESSY